MANADTAILLELVKTAGETCPPAELVRQSTAKLYERAALNKVVYSLSHFLECQHCRPLLSSSFLTKLDRHHQASVFSDLIYERERQNLTDFLKRKKIKAIFFKDSPTKSQQQLFLVSDIDLLTDQRVARVLDQWLTKNGYKKTAYPPKEITYSKDSRLDVDVHTQIAHPHFGTLTKSEKRIVEKFSKALLTKIKANQQKFFIQDKNYQLLSLCIRFLFNDLATGLGTLHEQVILANTFKKPKEWVSFLHLAEQYQFKNAVWLMLLLGRRFFSIPLPDFVVHGTPGRVVFLANILPAAWFVEFPALKAWHSKKNKSVVMDSYNRLKLIKLILKEDTSLFRLLRPRIALFFWRAGWQNIKKWRNSWR